MRRPEGPPPTTPPGPAAQNATPARPTGAGPVSPNGPAQNGPAQNRPAGYGTAARGTTAGPAATGATQAGTPAAAASRTVPTPPASRTGRRRKPEPEGATRVAPLPADEEQPDAPSGAGEPTALTDASEIPGIPHRRHRAEPEGRLQKVTALVAPGIETVRTKLGILDAEQKAALTPGELKARRRKQIRWSLIGSAASVVLLPLLLLGLGWLMFPVPTPEDAVNNQIATVSYTDGGQLARLVPEQGNRIKVPMEQIPVHVREAVLAAEDRTFYSNPGFDITGIMRAAFKQVTGGAGGGSTITQQYVKNTLVGDDATYWRKYKELIVSLKVSQEKSKDEILNDYLNAIYFGRGAYGIESAGLAYFGKPAAELTPSEAALLAGVIQSPSNWDPANDAAKAQARWNFVMDGMLQQGWITRDERTTARFPATVPSENTSRSSSLTDERGHILNAVRSELSSLGISEQAFAQGGLQISTTIDPQRQQQLVDAVRAEMEGQPDVLRSAAVAMDPNTGSIVGYYGGDNGAGLDYAQVMKQPGSTFKPFAVLAGLLADPPIGIGTEYDGSERDGLRNADGANCPSCDLKQAMTISNNVIFTKLAAEVGPQNVADAARLAGITAPLESPDRRLPLGNKEVTPIQLASAYATIADGGVWHAPHMVSKVVDSEGRVLYEYSPGEGEQRFPEQVARNVTEAMLGVVSHDELDLPSGQEAAGKTGTVQSRFEGQNNDAWFAGFTPDLVSTVWVGTDRNDPIQDARGNPINGSDLPGDVWQEFMSTAVRSVGDTVEFDPFRAIGESPSEAPPNAPTETSTPSPTSTPSTPTPERSAPPAEPPPSGPPPESSAPPPPVEEPSLTPERSADPLSTPDEDAPGEDAGRDPDEPTFG
ncbi:transglycosylase domain-containing protein [Pseudonocardia nantongensis]|uniref:transglycosylase domain-containing protein n=1 Tax=Pseudonocardia nantongensis TaxID=1181885 RepID=UPI00397A69BF